MTLRLYNPERDHQAMRRIWLECGWIAAESKVAAKRLDVLLDTATTHIAELGGDAESVAMTMPGSMRYLDEDLALSCVTAVLTSRVARKQGLASRVTARAVAHDAERGAPISTLGMFDQGYYNRLGFGTGTYETMISFDPATLLVSAKPRPPVRLTADDFERVHAARLGRMRWHGTCNLDPPGFTQAEMLMTSIGFGLGYEDPTSGELTHHLWCHPENVIEGPYRVDWLAFQTREQFLELMELLKGLGDQVRSVRIAEPPGIQMQDLLANPLRHQRITKQARLAASMRAIGFWQTRICDLAGCLERTHLASGPGVRFNLRLGDPIAKYLDPGEGWRGIQGEYVVTLGEESQAIPGCQKALPTLTASVGAFTRLWLGVRPASGLAMIDELAGPLELITDLDRVVRLPPPHPDWAY